MVVWWAKGSLEKKNRYLAVYALGLLACCIWHEQPWPYFFVILVPTLPLLITQLMNVGPSRPLMLVPSLSQPKSTCSF